MTSKKSILVIDIPGLSAELINTLPDGAYLKKLAASSGCLTLVPDVPSVTCPVQASILTGTPPASHGVIANGLYDRKRMKVSLWEQSGKLVQGQRMWMRLKEQFDGFTAGTLFWQFAMGNTADITLTPAPIHTHHGLVLSCYSAPTELERDLEEKLGPFDLASYWGPGAGMDSSKWIASATAHVLETYQPNLLFTYLPQLDYTLQRTGPVSQEAIHDLATLDALVAELAKQMRGLDGRTVILSEYSMLPVAGDIPINRLLLHEDLIAVRHVQGKTYPDPAGSRVVALPDHQVVHIYLNDLEAAGPARECLESADGVAAVYSRNELSRLQLNHPNAGDLVALAAPDRWFSYPWWDKLEAAPDFAFTIDIHNKPGYDPLELFFDENTNTISQDPLQVKASHGRPECVGVFMDDNGLNKTTQKGEIYAAEIAAYLATCYE